MSRKEFLIKIGRSIILLGLSVLSIFLIFRERNPYADCTIDLCGNCRELKKCKAPEAVKTRREKSEIKS